MYATAFGARDVLIGLAVAGVPGALWPEVPNVGGLVITAGLIVYAPMLAYGMIAARLFDVDLRIKWTIRRGTLAAVFVAVFFAASEGAAAFFESQTGSTAVGIGAAALLVFAIAPLQRLADRVADAAMPGVRADDPEYMRLRKVDVYRAALEGAIADSEVTPREREMLTRQLELGIANADAREMERDMLAAPRPDAA